MYDGDIEEPRIYSDASTLSIYPSIRLDQQRYKKIKNFNMRKGKTGVLGRNAEPETKLSETCCEERKTEIVKAKKV